MLYCDALTKNFIALDILQMLDCHLQNICLFQLRLLFKGQNVYGEAILYSYKTRCVKECSTSFWILLGLLWIQRCVYLHQAWRPQLQFVSVDPDSDLFVPFFFSQSGVCGAEKTCKKTSRTSRWQVKPMRFEVVLSYLSVFFSTGVLLTCILLEVASSHLQWFLCTPPGDCRVFLRPSALRTACIYRRGISMWMHVLFGLDIFPHALSHHSQMTGHRLYSSAAPRHTHT